MAYKQPRPIIVSEGGTGATTLTNHGVLLGQGTSAIAVTAVGTTGQVLTGVTASDPVWAAPAASSISITGNSGGALVGNAFTFTGGTTGLTFSGAGTTETLTGTLAIANGGTNATSMATTDGTVYYDGTRLVTTATGTAGQFLRSGGAGVAPAYATLPASSITITGDSGGALAGAAFTFTGGTTGLSFSGAGTTETLTGTLIVANGGTGRATLTNHGVIVGAGTTAVTQLAVGTNGQALIGSTGADPVFATIGYSAGSITSTAGAGTLNLDVANWVTNTSFNPTITLGGGSTGLTYNYQTGSYTRIGKTVFFNAQVGLTNKGSSTGAIKIGGLPVTSVTNSSPVCPTLLQVVTFTGTPTAFVDANATTISLGTFASTGNFTALTDTALANTSQIAIAGHYFTA